MKFGRLHVCSHRIYMQYKSAKYMVLHIKVYRKLIEQRLWCCFYLLREVVVKVYTLVHSEIKICNL
jgi:hypothetical protein